VFDRDVRVSWFGARLFLCGSVENKVDLCRFATKHMPYLLSVISPSVREGNRQVPPSRATDQPGRLKCRSFRFTRMYTGFRVSQFVSKEGLINLISVTVGYYVTA
jgi:hypothetical protein